MADHGQAGTPRPWPLHALSWEQPCRSASVLPAPAQPPHAHHPASFWKPACVPWAPVYEPEALGGRVTPAPEPKLCCPHCLNLPCPLWPSHKEPGSHSWGFLTLGLSRLPPARSPGVQDLTTAQSAAEGCWPLRGGSESLLLPLTGGGRITTALGASGHRWREPGIAGSVPGRCGEQGSAWPRLMPPRPGRRGRDSPHCHGGRGAPKSLA